MDSKKRFQNQVAVITGSAGGIGLATAKRLCMEGAQVVLVDLNEDKLRSAQKSLSEFGSPVLTSVCDVSNPDDVAATIQSALKHFGKIDVIVNNAGLMVFKPIEEQTPEDWKKILGVDLLGTFYFIQQGFLHMKNGGTIVNVSSIHALETTPLVASYAAAKSAVVSLTRSAALEGKPKKIRVNAVLPGAVDTPMLWENPNIKAGLEVIKQGDVGKAEDIASAIAYLASSDSNFIQGATLRVDGGRLAQL
jgi:NAD(P)-dependent dehydrogenase (short-subunit alcohol dehydrogenase family)